MIAEAMTHKVLQNALTNVYNNFIYFHLHSDIVPCSDTYIKHLSLISCTATHFCCSIISCDDRSIFHACWTADREFPDLSRYLLLSLLIIRDECRCTGKPRFVSSVRHRLRV
jgi:hypothetical protein